jgi:hypothetical protein
VAQQSSSRRGRGSRGRWHARGHGHGGAGWTQPDVCPPRAYSCMTTTRSARAIHNTSHAPHPAFRSNSSQPIPPRTSCTRRHTQQPAQPGPSTGRGLARPRALGSSRPPTQASAPSSCCACCACCAAGCWSPSFCCCSWPAGDGEGDLQGAAARADQPGRCQSARVQVCRCVRVCNAQQPRCGVGGLRPPAQPPGSSIRRSCRQLVSTSGGWVLPAACCWPPASSSPAAAIAPARTGRRRRRRTARRYGRWPGRRRSTAARRSLAYLPPAVS